MRVPLSVSLVLISLAAGLPAPAAGQARDAAVVGRVSSEEGPVAYASVLVEGKAGAVLTDPEGAFAIRELAPGVITLVVSAQGYATKAVTVDLSGGGVVRTEVLLRSSPVELDPITVTGTLKQARVSESTVKVEVVPAAVLQRVVSNNLMESIPYVNGLYQQVDCGVCYTNSIRINGMEGPYTAVLIDGMPIMSALASVYGLNGINPSIIERIEILKGPSSTLYGTEAMAGVVNVITKDARFAPLAAVEAWVSGHGEQNLDFALAPSAGELATLVSGNLSRLDSFHDDNGDGFSDAPLFTRAALFGKADVVRDGRRALSVTAKGYYEDRFGGVEAWTEDDRGSSTVYGESIDTRRGELLGSWLLPWGDDRLTADLSVTHHDQDSFYGDTRYQASQSIVYGQLLWRERIAAHDLLVGATTRWQRYDDSTPATARPESRWIPGVLVQDEWSALRGLTLLVGARVDHHEEHGVITSPRASAKWQPLERTTLRLNAGTGFRVVNLFTEDHAALTGARDVVIAEALDPERSWSVAANLNQVVEFGPSPMMIDLDVFFTRFSNKIVPDYDRDPDLIVYENLDGHSVSRGVSLSLNQNVAFERLLYTVGATVMDVHAEEDGVRSAELFAPDWTATWGLTYNHPAPDVSVDYTGRLTGPMRLPRYDPPFDRPVESDVYTVHDLKLTWRMGGRLELFGAASNLLDFTQDTPLIDPGNPFGADFDTAYVWGPIQGRELALGARWGISR